MASNDPSPGELVHEAKELDAKAAQLHASASGSAEQQAAAEAAAQEWEAADGVTSKIEGFTAGEPPQD